MGPALLPPPPSAPQHDATADMPIVPLSLTLLPLLLRNTDDIIETCLLCDGRNEIISITKCLPIIIQLMLPCCSILTKTFYKLIFMFLILCLKLAYSLVVIKIIQLINILNTISQLCHFIPFWVPFLLIVMSNETLVIINSSPSVIGM